MIELWTKWQHIFVGAILFWIITFEKDIDQLDLNIHALKAGSALPAFKVCVLHEVFFKDYLKS